MKRIRQETLSTRLVNAVNIHSTYVRLATSTTTGGRGFRTCAHRFYMRAGQRN